MNDLIQEIRKQRAEAEAAAAELKAAEAAAGIPQKKKRVALAKVELECLRETLLDELKEVPVADRPKGASVSIKYVTEVTDASLVPVEAMSIDPKKLEPGMLGTEQVRKYSLRVTK
jgi:hypothetical protein